MLDRKPWSRRDLLRLSVAAIPLAMAPRVLLAESCAVTPEQTEGPFYMAGLPGIPRALTPNDLTRVRADRPLADGEMVWVAGRVLDRDCRPVAGARVEIWQACATGRYAHPRDGNPAALDPNFGYAGYDMTDAQGAYVFKTIKPGPYPVGGGWVRPSHIHFRIEPPGFRRLTTQMYFAGDPYQEQDSVLRGVPPAQRRAVVIEPSRHPEEPGGPENYFRFELALRSV